MAGKGRRMTGRTRAVVSTNVCAGCGILTSTNECSGRCANTPGADPEPLGGLMDKADATPHVKGAAT